MILMSKIRERKKYLVGENIMFGLELGLELRLGLGEAVMDT